MVLNTVAMLRGLHRALIEDAAHLLATDYESVKLDTLSKQLLKYQPFVAILERYKVQLAGIVKKGAEEAHPSLVQAYINGSGQTTVPPSALRLSPTGAALGPSFIATDSIFMGISQVRDALARYLMGGDGSPPIKSLEVQLAAETAAAARRKGEDKGKAGKLHTYVSHLRRGGQGRCDFLRVVESIDGSVHEGKAKKGFAAAWVQRWYPELVVGSLEYATEYAAAAEALLSQ